MPTGPIGQQYELKPCPSLVFVPSKKNKRSPPPRSFFCLSRQFLRASADRPSESMAYTGKIRGMKEEGCQTLLETFVKLYIEEQFKGQEDIGTKVIETTGFKVDDRSDL